MYILLMSTICQQENAGCGTSAAFPDDCHDTSCGTHRQSITGLGTPISVQLVACRAGVLIGSLEAQEIGLPVSKFGSNIERLKHEAQNQALTKLISVHVPTCKFSSKIVKQHLQEWQNVLFECLLVVAILKWRVLVLQC